MEGNAAVQEHVDQTADQGDELGNGAPENTAEADVSRETHESDDNQESKKEGYKEEKESEGFSQEETQQIQTFMKKMKLPKEVTYLLDKNGNLKFVVPSDGKKYAITPEELVKGWNLNQVGYQRLSEGKRLQGELKQYFQELKKNPQQMWDLADRLGVDKYDLAKKLLEERLEYEELSDSERRALQLEKEKERLQQELEEKRANEENQKLQRLASEEAERHEKELITAMNKHGFQRHDRRTKSHIMISAVNKMLLAGKNNQQLSADDAVYLAKQEWQDFVSAVYSDIDDNHILELVPSRIVEAIRKADLSKLKSGEIPTSRAISGQEIELDGKEIEDASSSKRGRRKQSIAEYFESL